MWLPAVGLILGIILGAILDIRIPSVYLNYLSIAVLASLDTIVGHL